MSSNDKNRRHDDELIDSLYAERDRPDARDTRDAASGEAGRVAEAEELDRELAQLRQLRGMFAELKANMPEPPPEGMAFLMAAARRAAEERKAVAGDLQPAGLWARLRAGWQAMVAHPAMAAAAAAVVVIGASGYLMSRGVGKQVEATYSSSEQVEELARRVDELEQGPGDDRAGPAASSAAPAMAPAPVAAEPASPTAGDGDVSGGAGAGAGSAPGSTGTPSGGKEDLRLRRPAKGEKPKAAPVDAVPAIEGGYGEAVGSGRDKDIARDKLDESFAKQNNDAAAAPSGASAPQPAQAPVPPPPPPPAETAKARPKKAAVAADRRLELDADTEAAPEEEEAPAPSKPRRVESVSQQAERWYQLARSEASKGNCKQVKLLGERVKSEDAGFYERQFRKDPSLQKCL